MGGQASAELQESSEVMVGAWRRIAENLPHPEIFSRDGLAVTWPNVPMFCFNMVFLTEPCGDAQQLSATVDRAVTVARSRTQPGVLSLTHDLLSGSAAGEADRILAERGYVPGLRIEGMSAKDFPLAQRSLPAGVQIERVGNGHDVMRLNCLAYDLPIEVGEASSPHERFWQESFAFVVLEEGRPVSTATTTVVGGVLYLALVATAPEVRRKGYAEAVVRRSLDEAHAATGLTRTMLHATEAGFPVYRRIGYTPVSKHTWYVPQP